MANLAQNNGTDNLEQLTKEKNRLIDLFRETNIKTRIDELLPQIKEIDAQIKVLKVSEMIDKANRKYGKLREIAKLAYECEQPAEDITISDMSFHKVKIKKYPKLAALQYARAKFEDNKLTELSISGDKFRMFNINYQYGKDNEYKRPETFNAFLELNSIPLEDFTMQSFTEFSDKLNALNEEIKAKMEVYSAEINKLKTHSYNYWGLAKQESTHFYIYSPATGY